MNKKIWLSFLIGAFLGGVLAAVVCISQNRKSVPETVLSPPMALRPQNFSPAASSVSDGDSLAPQTTDSFEQMMDSGADAHSQFYTVVKGDTLTAIAKKHRVTADILEIINGVTAKRLIPGKKLKIPSYHFSIIVDKSLNKLILKGDEQPLKTYTVSTGTNNSTPVGTFKITDKLINPTWYTAGAVVPADSPKNVLGTRWMGFNLKSYGIHGTTEPEQLGRQVTAGCVRMRNEEVEELFRIVPSGTEVTIID